MKKPATPFLAVILLPTLVVAAELRGTVEKLDQAKNQLVLKTARGEETLEITKKYEGH